MNNSFARRALVALVISAGAIAHAQEKETIRPEVGKPLQAAQELLKAHKPKEALGEITKAAAQEALADIQADEKAGKAPPEDRLQLLANAYLKQNDPNRYAWSLEKLVAYYPKKEYWADLITRTQKKMTFAERLALDVLRLR